jgi:hypothetical protein
VGGTGASYTADASAWARITKLGPSFYWRFTGKFATGETTFSDVHNTAITGGPAVALPVAGSISSSDTLTWDMTGFTGCIVQASKTAIFPAKPLVLGSVKAPAAGSLVLSAVWSKLTALGSADVYIRVVGTTLEKYTAYGDATHYTLIP